MTQQSHRNAQAAVRSDVLRGPQQHAAILEGVVHGAGPEIVPVQRGPRLRVGRRRVAGLGIAAAAASGCLAAVHDTVTLILCGLRSCSNHVA